ncbi:hypothetical protein [Devosia sp. 2618]
MAAQAQIIDLNAYRQSKAPSPAVTTSTLPFVYVAWWTFVPVVFVPGHA